MVYFSILCIRYHTGIVTDEMLSLPKTPFLAVGLLEALAAASGMAAGGMLAYENYYLLQLILSSDISVKPVTVCIIRIRQVLGARYQLFSR